MKSELDNLLPRPREVRPGENRVELDLSAAAVDAPDLSPRAARAVRRCLDSSDRSDTPERTAPSLRIAPLGSISLPAQGYQLRIDREGAILEGADEAGLFYGLQTLRQIRRLHGVDVPELLIRDYPDFRDRGYMLDVSRCKVPRMESLYVLMDRLAALKINQLQLYTEHTFAFPGHDVVWRDASPFTAEEIRTLDAYCRDRYIELVPNLNSFGHLERWLRHPEYHHLAESPGGFVDPWGTHRPFGSTLKPNDDSLAFLDSLYGAFLPHFSSGRFNIGCDETWELGQGWSRPLVEEKGASRVYLDFLLRIQALAEKHGRRVQFWGDIILKNPECVAELPASITGMIWGYEADHPYEANCRTFFDAGVPFQVVPGTSSWKSLLGRVDNCLATLDTAAENGLRFGAEGLLVTDWGDAGHHQFFPIGLPGIVYGAALAWGVERNRGLDLAAALDRHVFGSPAAGMGWVLLELGETYRDTGKLTNQSTLFHHLLFADSGRLDGWLDGVSPEALRDTRAHLDRLGAELAAASPRCPDGDLARREIALNIRMARHAVDRGLARLEPERADSEGLRHDLAGIVESFGPLWLERARPGGLPESLGYLEAVRSGY